MARPLHTDAYLTIRTGSCRRRKSWHILVQWHQTANDQTAKRADDQTAKRASDQTTKRADDQTASDQAIIEQELSERWRLQRTRSVDGTYRSALFYGRWFGFYRALHIPIFPVTTPVFPVTHVKL